MTKYSRIFLICMGLLDAVCLGRYLDTVSLDYLSYQTPLWFLILHSVSIVMLCSLAVSAYGLVMTYKWAMWLSYAQFPARAIQLILSFGWLTLAARFLGHDAYQLLVYVAIGLEFTRLALTIIIHRGMNRSTATSA
jgi:hypothetical protein